MWCVCVRVWCSHRTCPPHQAEAALADVVVFASLSAAFAGNFVDQAAVPKVAAYFTTLSARGDAQAASKLASAIVSAIAIEVLIRAHRRP